VIPVRRRFEEHFGEDERYSLSDFTSVAAVYILPYSQFQWLSQSKKNGFQRGSTVGYSWLSGTLPKRLPLKENF
jgi:hypothetical protein